MLGNSPAKSKFTSSLFKNQKKDLYFWPLNGFFEDEFLGKLKIHLFQKMKDFVSSKLIASQEDLESGLGEASSQVVSIINFLDQS